MAPLSGLLGKKIGMTQFFTELGDAVPVTVIQAGPCAVLQVRDAKRDGYDAVQLGFDDKKKTRATKSETAHAAKAKAVPKRFVREMPFAGAPGGVEAGQTVTVEIFEGVKTVDVIGTNKGRGFAGVMKRHNFSGGDKTHGSKSHRKPGSIGMHTWPARVLKGQRMSGHMGNVRRTVRNLEVAALDKEQGYLFVHGSVPGPVGGYVIVRRAKDEARSAPAAAAAGKGGK